MKHLVVGRTSSLGEDLTVVLHGRGDAVVGTARRPTDSMDVRCDVTSSDDVGAAVAEADERLDGIDSLVYLAGQAADSRTEKLADSEFARTMDVNATGAFRFAKTVLALGKPCCVTFVGTTNALRGSAGQAAYASSKAALLGLTRSLAAEFGPRGRRVNLVAPGYFSGGLTESLPTRLKDRIEREIPVRRFGSTREITNVVAFAASGASTYMNGSIIYVDGGPGARTSCPFPARGRRGTSSRTSSRPSRSCRPTCSPRSTRCSARTPSPERATTTRDCSFSGTEPNESPKYSNR